jgi:hypothetical protein
MSSKRRFITVSVLSAAMACAGLLAPSALAGKPARGKASAKSAPAETTAIARNNKAKPARAPKPGRSKLSPALAPKDERDVTNDAPAAGPSTSTVVTPAPAAPAKARVYTFGGLDVTGNLKAPQMLFFRGRVQQELDTSSPEKRSFLKELERTADAQGL